MKIRLMAIIDGIRELFLFLEFLRDKFRLEFLLWKMDRSHNELKKKIGNKIMPAMKSWVDSLRDLVNEP